MIHTHTIADRDISHVFALSYLRGTQLHFYCRSCRAEVKQSSHPQAAQQLIDYFNKSVSNRVAILCGKLQPKLVP